MQLPKFLLLVFCLATQPAFSRKSAEVVLKTATGSLYGTLQFPDIASKKVPVVLIIPGSGPTDRDGNNKYQVNNSLRMVADSLAAHGIASLRYDKRGIGASKAAMPSETNIRFGHYVSDARGWIGWLHKDKRFGRIIVFGHSEGSLIGMLAVQSAPASALISAEGTSVTADKLLIEQLGRSPQMPPGMLDSCRRIFDIMRSGHTVDSVPRGLLAVFRPAVQPYIISWMKYDPLAELQKVKVPVLILQGTTDLQVDVEQGKQLAKSLPSARLEVIEGMNHILKPAPADLNGNFSTYNDPEIPLKGELVIAMVAFIRDIPSAR